MMSKKKNNSNNSLSVNKLVPLFTAVLMLSACNGGTSDLDEYFSVQRGIPAAPIDPIPEVKPYLRYIYPEHEKDPFDAAMLAPNTVREEIVDNGINIDTTRVPEFLEGFPLDSLRMVGTVEKDDTLWALVRIPDGAVQTVKPGNFLGQNYGKIVNISDVKMDMLETVSNGLGGFKKREISITLNQE
jgi:type IV pilus assembly protein PilP